MNDKKVKLLYVDMGKVSGLDRRSNQPPDSFQPKPNSEQGPNSPPFCEGWRGEEAAEESLKPAEVGS